MSFSFLFFLFFFLARIVAGQWWPQPHRHPLMRTQALTTPTLSPVQPTGPVASMSDTCSCRQPNPTATATTWTVAAPTAAARPTPAQKYSDKFFFVFFFSSQPDMTMAASLPSSPPPSPACRQSRLHAILLKPQPAAAMTSSPPQPWPLQPLLPQLSSPQPPPPPPQSPRPNCHCPNRHHHPDSIPTTAPTAPLLPVSPDPHLQRHPSYTSTSSMYLFKCQIYYFLCMNVTNLV